MKSIANRLLQSLTLILIINDNIEGGMKSYKIREYSSGAASTPFRIWLDSLDVRTKARVQARILRFENGNLGDWKMVGAGVHEARLNFGSGYRVYFGIDGSILIILLIGGDKASQRQDIVTAKEFWSDYRRSQNDKAK